MMEAQILYQETDERGKVFTIFGASEDVILHINQLLAAEYEEYQLVSCQCEHKEEVTQGQRDIENLKLILIKDRLLEEDYKSWFDDIPRKKDGTFAKKRVHVLWRGYTYEQYFEDSYGYDGPEITIRSIDDYNAVLTYENRIRKY